MSQPLVACPWRPVYSILLEIYSRVGGCALPRMKKMQEMVHDVHVDFIPRLFTLRRVPIRYRRALPLEVMKRYQCVVVGGVRGALTVAIADQKNAHIFQVLSKLTGCTIFPVLVDPNRLSLLIQRIERSERDRSHRLSRRSPAHSLLIRSMLMFFTLQSKRQYGSG